MNIIRGLLDKSLRCDSFIIPYFSVITIITTTTIITITTITITTITMRIIITTSINLRNDQ